MADGYILSESDAEILRQAIPHLAQVVQNARNRGGIDLEAIPQAPETYLAWVPVSGIPGMDFGGTGTGDDSPSSAECGIYRRVGPDPSRIIPTGRRETVYSFLRADVPEGWCLVERDKFGTWWAAEFDPESVVSTFSGAAIFADDTINLNTDTPEFDTVLWDTSGGEYTFAPDVFTIPRTGYYRFTAYALVTRHSGMVDAFSALLIATANGGSVNGLGTARAFLDVSADTSSGMLIISTDLSLNQADTLQFLWSSGGLDVDVSERKATIQHLNNT